ncbi:MAG: hypothetical protein AAFV07_16200 [Bacteroidota bacterium]
MKQNEAHEVLIKSLSQLERYLEQFGKLDHCTLQNLDLTALSLDWAALPLENATFLGCEIPFEAEIALRQKGAHVYPKQGGLPYEPYRKTLYTWQELMEGYAEGNDQSLDWQIYDHFSESRNNPDINEALCQRIHDHAIDDALRDLVGYDDDGMTRLKCVGIMGGHSTGRDKHWYRQTAFVAQQLAAAGFYVVSGGGPGTMEAANLGAYFGGYAAEDLQAALDILQRAPKYGTHAYFEAAWEVLERWPTGVDNLAIPTWFYGHEPSNFFGTQIAKYFSNSIREDNLLAISLYGVVFAPGSAGTTQEIFQDAAQNHYATYGYYSPMAFMGRERYEIKTSLFPLLKQLAWEKPYFDMLTLSDEPEEIVQFIQAHPPIRK